MALTDIGCQSESSDFGNCLDRPTNIKVAKWKSQSKVKQSAIIVVFSMGVLLQSWEFHTSEEKKGKIFILTSFYNVETSDAGA